VTLTDDTKERKDRVEKPQDQKGQSLQEYRIYWRNLRAFFLVWPQKNLGA
jgi:hypothetical protein